MIFSKNPERGEEIISFFAPYIKGFEKEFSLYVREIMNDEKVRTEGGHVCYMENNLEIAKLIPKDKVVIDIGCSFGLQHVLYRDHAGYVGIQKFREGTNCDMDFKPEFRIFTDNAQIIEGNFKDVWQTLNITDKNKDNFFGIANRSLWHDSSLNKEDIKIFVKLFPKNNYATDESGIKVIY